MFLGNYDYWCFRGDINHGLDRCDGMKFQGQWKGINLPEKISMLRIYISLVPLSPLVGGG
jgi:hypothetical protein